MKARRHISPRHPAFLKHRDHQRLWRMVEGAVVDTFKSHPDYLTAKGAHSVVPSVTKRVVGTLVGHAKEAQKRGPLGASCGGGVDSCPPQAAGSVVGAPRSRFQALHGILCGGEQ